MGSSSSSSSSNNTTSTVAAAVLAAALMTTAHPAYAGEDFVASGSGSSVPAVYFGNGCFWGRQKDFVDTEMKQLGRTSPAEISALVGYAGDNSSSNNAAAAADKRRYLVLTITCSSGCQLDYQIMVLLHVFAGCQILSTLSMYFSQMLMSGKHRNTICCRQDPFHKDVA